MNVAAEISLSRQATVFVNDWPFGIPLMAQSCYHFPFTHPRTCKALAMNKKVQKQLDVAKKKLTNLQQQLSGAKKQPDDPAEIPRLENEIALLLAEIHKLKSEP